MCEEGVSLSAVSPVSRCFCSCSFWRRAVGVSAVAGIVCQLRKQRSWSGPCKGCSGTKKPATWAGFRCLKTVPGYGKTVPSCFDSTAFALMGASFAPPQKLRPKMSRMASTRSPTSVADAQVFS